MCNGADAAGVTVGADCIVAVAGAVALAGAVAGRWAPVGVAAGVATAGVIAGVGCVAGSDSNLLTRKALRPAAGRCPLWTISGHRGRSESARNCKILILN